MIGDVYENEIFQLNVKQLKTFNMELCVIFKRKSVDIIRNDICAYKINQQIEQVKIHL